MLALAMHVSGWSKDPSTRVGAVITDGRHRVLGLGYNGFPRGVRDEAARLVDREQKYPLTVHAELNAILNCSRRDLAGCTLYTIPRPPCPGCAAAIVQAGVQRVVCLLPEPPANATVYHDWHPAARTALSEGGVELVQFKFEELVGNVVP